MPEGPSLVIAKEDLLQFKGKKIISAGGTESKIDISRMTGRTLKAVLTWGKHLLLYFGSDLTLRIHFQMDGTYYVNKKQEALPQLHLVFDNNITLDIYTSVLKYIEQPLEDLYSWQTDVMSKEWHPAYVRELISKQPANTMVCDLLLNQDVFTGVGNIIKNEALYRARIHPESLAARLPPAKLNDLLRETIGYSYDFLHWRKMNQLSAHFLVYERDCCPVHHTLLCKEATGKTKRRSYWCHTCQLLY